VIVGFRFRDAVLDDLIQDTFVAAWKSLDSLNDAAAFGGWIAVIARNQCLQHLRRQKEMVSISGTDAIDESGEGESSQSPVVLVAGDVMESLHWEQSVELCRQVIMAYKEEPRSTIARLFYIEQQPIKEICSGTGLNQNTVLSHLRRFRQVVSESLKQLIDEAGIESFA